MIKCVYSVSYGYIFKTEKFSNIRDFLKQPLKYYYYYYKSSQLSVSYESIITIIIIIRRKVLYTVRVSVNLACCRYEMTCPPSSLRYHFREIYTTKKLHKFFCTHPA